jgi:5'-3' exonuclease
MNLIVDVSNLAYRSAYGHKELSTSTGRFSGHVFGAVDSLLSVLRKELKGETVKIIFCYDGDKSKDYRRTILPEYKGNRVPHEMDPIPEVEEVLRLWPGLHIKQDDKEGDDGIAFAVKMSKGAPCVVLSGDKDLWPLLQHSNVRVLSPNFKRFVETSDFMKPYHLNGHPERIPLAKALFGDSDGIKGIERLLKKQVAPFLNAPGVQTPEDFYNAMGSDKPDCISDKMWQKLLDGIDKVIKNYQVILPQLDFDRSSVTNVKGDFTALKAKLAEYECFSLVNQL